MSIAARGSVEIAALCAYVFWGWLIAMLCEDELKGTHCVIEVVLLSSLVGKDLVYGRARR